MLLHVLVCYCKEMHVRNSRFPRLNISPQTALVKKLHIICAKQVLLKEESVDPDLNANTRGPV